MPTDISESIKAKSPFRRGADDGAVMGLMLIAVFFTGAMSFDHKLASTLTPVLMLAGVPLLTYAMLRRSYVRDNGMTIFSSLWTQGIVTFFCGSLILAMFMYVYMRWLSPDFMRLTVSHIADFYDSIPDNPQSKEVAGIFHTMLDDNIFPSAISVAVEAIWLGVFSGSILSMLAAVAARSRSVTPRSGDKSQHHSI